MTEQNRAEFIELADKVLAFDIARYPENRLLNVLAKRRALWLKENVDEFFLESGT